MVQKFKVEQLPFFEDLAKVIGKTQAKCELFKVYNSEEVEFFNEDAEDIIDCFAWNSTPQGNGFWTDIYHKVKDNAEN